MRYTLTLLLILASITGQAQLADCAPPFSQVELDINNVRLIVSNGLQHFENNGDAGYQVPKLAPGENGPNSIYADGLWIGGFTPDGQLKSAAVTYRSGGATDYYPGPLRTDSTASTEPEICAQYDAVYLADRTEAILHREYYDRLELVAGGADPAILTEAPFENGYEIPEGFNDWPATNPNSDFNYYLAPFIDRNGDGEYVPADGDYPGFDLDGNLDCASDDPNEYRPLLGHRAAWYVSNDAGEHTESGGIEIGLELQVTTFQYAGCGAIDNTTFTRTLIINRGVNTLADCTIGKWLDMDLGCPTDDYVGCDVNRGLAYTYNADLDDSPCDGVPGYGTQIAAQGVKIFAGPQQDLDGIDNPLTADIILAMELDGITYDGQGTGYGDGIIDNERLGMRHFVYYNRNDQTPTPNTNGEPNLAQDYYGLMNSIWKDGSHVTHGGNGVGGSLEADYMFPADSDPLGVSTDGQITNANWSEISEAHQPGDRRFILSTGNFTLEPGEVNEMIVGYIWAQDETGETNALDHLLEAADEVQAHFDNCFQFIDEYPQLTAFDYTQDGASFDFSFPMYAATDITWDLGDGSTSTGNSVQHEYSAPGYYDVCVSHSLCGAEEEICNTIYVGPGEFYPLLRMTRTEGRGCGTHYIQILEEEIDNMLVNEDYYEPELTYFTDLGPIKVAVYDETLFQTGDYAIRLYGDDNDQLEDVVDWKLWKIGTTDTIFSQQTIDILVDQYIPMYGLVVSIVQPEHVVSNSFNVIPKLLRASKSYANQEMQWLSGVSDTDDLTEENWIRAGENTLFGNDCDYEAPANDCYYGDFAGIDSEERFENILDGTWSPWHLVARSQLGPASIEDNYQSSSSTIMTDLNNVVMRFTADKSHWTRSSVLETGYSTQLTQGGAKKLHPRIALSVDKNGLNQLSGGNLDECTMNGTQVMTQDMLDELEASEREAYKLSAFPGQDPSSIPDSDLLGLSFGMGWFPGYAVDVETGYRLNIMFGENSSFPLQNGSDMLWNPTSEVYSGNLDAPVFGGGHYVYVLRNHLVDQASNSAIRMPGYDKGNFSFINLPLGSERKRVFRACTWVSIPLLAPGYELLSIAEGLIPTEVTIRLAVSKEYLGQMYDTFDDESGRYPLYNFTVPEDIFSDVDEYTDAPQFSIYPNPASTELFISTLDESLQIERIRILDLTGKVLQHIDSPQILRVDISSLASGVFIIEVEDQNGHRSVNRFLKQR